jgi:hypothetical protein
MKYSVICFWEGYCYNNNQFTNNYFKNYNYSAALMRDGLYAEPLESGVTNESMIPNEFNDIKFIIVGPFINEYYYNIINKLNCIKLLYICEPIKEYEHFNFTIKLLNQNIFDIIFGCINNKENIRYKLPLYMEYFDYKNKNIYNLTNEYVKKCNINNKKFCSLINTHDKKNTRTKIYNYLKEIKHITCPSNLFNNTSNEELNNIGNIEYIKKFKFNICSENCITDLEGYITEKLLNCCLGGAIPIYCGWFDEIDEKIFNKNRILFFEPNNEESINNVYNKVKELMEDDNKLNDFYKMDVFMETAYETIKKLQDNLFNKIKNL